MAEKLSKISPEHWRTRKVSLNDVEQVYFMLESFYKNLRAGGEEFCRDLYAVNMEKLLKSNTLILNDGTNDMALFTFCKEPVVEFKALDNKKALYVEALTLFNGFGEEGVEKCLFKGIERKARDNYDFLRSSAIDWLADFYVRNGFSMKTSRKYQDYNIVLFEKKLK